MLDRAELEAVRTIVAHDDCADGTASAVVLHDALPDAEVVFVDYGETAERLPVTPHMLFCDFAPPAARAREFVDAGAIVLDHHKSARGVVESFGARGVFADEIKEPGVSGAVLAFRHVWEPLARGRTHHAFAEWFATAAGVRDTWHKQHPAWHDGRVQHAVLMTFPQRFWLTMSLAELARTWTERYAWIGEQLIVQQRERVEQLVVEAHRFTARDGTRVVASPSLYAASDFAERIGDDADVVFCFGFGSRDGIPEMRVSLRSHARFDCATFAQRFGGGGHTRAAGFAYPLGPDDPQPFRLIERIFDQG